MPARRSPARKPAQAAKPRAASDPQVQPHNPGTAISQPDPAYAVRFQAPVSRVCAYCAEPRPLDALSPWGTSMICREMTGCDQRAARRGLYPQREDELQIAARELRQGAL